MTLAGGRPPKPLELKRRLGNPGKRPLPETLTTVDPTPAAADRPRFKDGGALLQHVLHHGGATWIGTTDVAADLLVDLYDDWRTARDVWRTSHAWTDFKLSDGLTGRLQTCLATLGLNPSDLGRLGLARVETRATGLAALRAERARMAGRPAG